jgi:hypothetical protein
MSTLMRCAVGAVKVLGTKKAGLLGPTFLVKVTRNAN